MKRSSSSVVRDELHHAVRKGRLSDVQVLVDQGVDIHAHFDTFPYGTVMHMAAYYGHWDLLAFFLNKGLDVNAIDNDDHDTPLHLVSRAGCAEVVQFLVEQHGNMYAVNKFGQKPIHEAAWFGRKDVVEMFLKKGMDVQEADGKGSTLLHLSCKAANLDLVQLLVNYKTDIHAKDAVGRKPIHVAAAWGQKDVVEYFLDLGMSVDETDKYGQTVLHLAAKAGHLKVVQFLVDRIGAKPQLDAQDNEGKTPMHVCIRYKSDIFNYLLDAGARYDIKDHDGRTVLFYFMWSRHYYIDNDRSVLAKLHHNFEDIDDQTKMTVAHFVLKASHNMDLIKLVLQHQKDLNIEDIYGETPMNYLTKHLSRRCWTFGIWKAVDMGMRETLIRMLVDYGAYLKVVDCERIVQNRSLKGKLFKDKKFCSQYLINKFDNVDLPKLTRLPSAIPLSVLEKLKLKSNHICQIERAVEEEIRNKGYCDVSKMASPLLSVLAIESYVSHYRAS